MSTSWTLLNSRLQKRAIRALDILSILSLDGLVLVAGYLLIRGVEQLAGAKSEFFHFASQLSHALFLLLFALMVFFDVRDFLAEEKLAAHDADRKISSKATGE